MNNSETLDHLNDQIDSIIDTYDTASNIQSHTATGTEVEAFFDYFGLDFDRDRWVDSDDDEIWASDWDEIADMANEAMRDYPLSIQATRVIFCTGGPHVEAEIDWDFDGRGVSVMYVTMFGAWAGTTVRREVPSTSGLFDEMEHLIESYVEAHR